MGDSAAATAGFDRLMAPANRVSRTDSARNGMACKRDRSLPPTARESDAHPGLIVVTLGGFRIYYGQEPIRFGRKIPRKPLELLKILIASGEKGSAKYRLVEALWPEAEGDAANQTLKITLHRLRRLVGAAALAHCDGWIGLNPAHCRVDSWDFERSLYQAEHDEDPEAATNKLKSAIRIYQGPFLHGVEAPWALATRERLRSRLLRVLAGHVNRLQERGACASAIELLQQALEVDDLSEEYYRQLMRCHVKLGRPAEALEVYRRCRDTLRRVLGLEPGAEMEMLYRRLLDASPGCATINGGKVM